MVYIYKVVTEYDPLCGTQESHSLAATVSSYDEAYDKIESLILSLKKYRWSILEAFREVGIKSIRFYISEEAIDIEK
jgi:hypothetical protein